MIENIRVGEPFGTSDHQIIRWNFLANKDFKNSESKKLNYFKGDNESEARCVQERLARFS